MRPAACLTAGKRRNRGPVAIRIARVVETLCGSLLLVGLATRLTATPLVLTMVVALASTKDDASPDGMRWLHHLVLRREVPAGDLAPASLATEGSAPRDPRTRPGRDDARLG